MTNGFGKREIWAERSLEQSSRELRALRKIIAQYKDDPKGRAKMMKKMKKYWNSNLATIKGLDYKPQGDAWQPPADLIEDLEALRQEAKQYEDPRPEVSEESIDNLTEADMSAVRDMLSKHREEDLIDDQSTSDLRSLSSHESETGS